MVAEADILNAKILVVDDNSTNIQLIQRLLRIAGYTAVESTTDPTQVHALCESRPFDLILLDLQMPVMDGFEVMKQLSEGRSGPSVPVIVSSAEPASKMAALKAGARDFVGKPFEMAEMRARVHNVVEIGLLHRENARLSAALARHLNSDFAIRL